MDIIEIIIFWTRILLAISIIPFIIIQWRIRKLNGLVRKLRWLTIWQTIALFALFINIAIFRDMAVTGGMKFPFWTQLFALFTTVGVFATFIRGVIFFLEIHNHRHEHEHHT